MKKWVSIVLIFSLLVACGSKMLVVSYYLANKEYIKTTLCENKNKPMLHCDGKCYMKKKLDATENPKASFPFLLKHLELAMHERVLSFLTEVVHLDELMTIHTSRYYMAYYSSPVDSILNPPQ
jgi:hypothetical protein